MKRSVLALLIALSVGIVCVNAPAVHAQTDKKPAPKTAMKQTYYVCAKCKVYYTDAAAKKMGYKDPMSHKLTKSTSIPKGYVDGSKEKMGGKMDSKSKM